MNDACHMKYTNHFYQLLIRSMLTYLTGVYGQAYMAKKPSEILEEQKANFARKASKPMSVKLTCTVCGNRTKVSSHDVEAWECHVRCGAKRANGA